MDDYTNNSTTNYISASSPETIRRVILSFRFPVSILHIYFDSKRGHHVAWFSADRPISQKTVRAMVDKAEKRAVK